MLPMSTMSFETGHIPRPEASADRERRIAWEAARIAKARASLMAGGVVSEKDVDAWVDSLGTDNELPPPTSGSNRNKPAASRFTL